MNTLKASNGWISLVVDEKKVVLRRMANEGLMEVFADQMKAIFRRDDVAWVAHGFVSQNL